MIKWIKSKMNLRWSSCSELEYGDCINDLIQHEMVNMMKNFMQHGDINCLEHSINVSYSSYIICKRLGLDYRSAARGGLLHDFFLYDWHFENPYKGQHGLIHPYISLQNANLYFNLNDREKDIIQKHMWPLTIRFPRYKESFVVLFADKYCAFIETVKFRSKQYIYNLKEIFGLEITDRA